MGWHAKPLVLHLRRFEPGKGYGDRFASIVTAQLLGDGRAFLCGFLNDGRTAPISREDRQELGELLRDDYGIGKIETERHHREKSYDTSPAPLG